MSTHTYTLSLGTVKRHRVLVLSGRFEPGISSHLHLYNRTVTVARNVVYPVQRRAVAIRMLDEHLGLEPSSLSDDELVQEFDADPECYSDYVAV